MTDVLEWIINLPTVFLPVAESLIAFFNTPLTDVITTIIDMAGMPDILVTILSTVLNAVTGAFGINVTIFDALLGAGLVMVLSLTIAKWVIGIIQ